MFAYLSSILATFTSPEPLGTNPGSLLWIIPLTVAIAVVYKAAKLSKIETRNFIKESVVLFGSIMLFWIAAGVGLIFIDWLVTQ